MSEQVEGQLTLFPADSPASRSPLPGSKEARKMTATSGQKWLGLSKNSGPLGLLEKMLLESLEWHSPIFYLNWKPVGIRQGHFLFQLALSEPGTDVTEWQSWPTPTAADSYTDKMKSSQQKEGSRHSVNLSSTVKMWDTPNTMDYLPQRSPEALKRQAEGNRKGRKRPANLREQVKLWPTPLARDWKGPRGQSYKGNATDLPQAIKMYPTPATGAGMCGDYQQLKKLKEQGVISEDERRNMSQGNGGQLNPYWVEWLMGFPPGWTEI